MICASSYDAAFLLPLDKEPTVSVAGAALGEGFALVSDNVWANRTRPEQSLHLDYQQYEAPADGPVELPLKGLGTVHTQSFVGSITRRNVLDFLCDRWRVTTAPLRLVSAHYYLEDVYEELGPTHFIAGSHLAGRPPRASDGSAYRGMPDQSLLVKGGDCVMFRSDVWHRGGGNTNGEPRHIIQVFYIDRWLVDRFHEGWEEERMTDAESKQRAAADSFPGGLHPNPDTVLKAKLSTPVSEFTYPAATLAAASPRLR